MNTQIQEIEGKIIQLNIGRLEALEWFLVKEYSAQSGLKSVELT